LIDVGRNRSEQLSPRELIRSLLVHRVKLLDLYELLHRQNDSLLRFQVGQQDCLSHLHVDFDILLQNSAIQSVLLQRLLHFDLRLHLMILELNVLWIIENVKLAVVEHFLLVPEEDLLEDVAVLAEAFLFV
jgi:hypothetical protein